MTRLSVLLLMAALAACGGPPSRVTFHVRAGPDINPDADAGPAPTDVRLFLLSSTVHLQNADYFALLDHERDVLDGDLLARRETIIRPNGSQDIRMDVPKGATDVGVVVGFRELDRAIWVATRKLPSNGNVPVVLSEWTVSLPDRLPSKQPRPALPSLPSLPSAPSLPSLPSTSLPSLPSTSFPSLPSTSLPSATLPSLPSVLKP